MLNNRVRVPRFTYHKLRRYLSMSKLASGDLSVLPEESSIKAEPFSYRWDPWKPALTKQDIRIRLIELYPPTSTSPSSLQSARNASPLSCRIFWVPLASPGSFKALSYTWGSNAKLHIINISGQEFAITESLDTALRNIRHSSRSIVVWIDQICIDQEHNEEKSEQVSSMGQIYRAAEEVLIWLGPS